MKEVLERFEERKVLVVGDICLDRTKLGDVVYGSSREADIPTVRYIHGKQGHRDEYSPGGGGNLAANLASLGARVSVMGLTGNDYAGEILRSELVARGIDISMLYGSPNKATILFERAYNFQDPTKPVGRWDTENHIQTSLHTLKGFAEFLEKYHQNFDVVVAIDHCEVDEETAIIRGPLLEKLSELKSKGIQTYGSSRNRIGQFADFYCLVPNENELVRATETYHPMSFEEQIPLDSIHKSADLLKNLLDPHQIVITRGAKGVLLAKGKDLETIPTKPLEWRIDTCGCGDTFLATLALAETSGASTEDSIRLANAAARTTAKKLGTTGTPKIEEILQEL